MSVKYPATVGGGGFSFTKANCANCEINNLGVHIEKYKHLRHIDLSSNKLTDIEQVIRLPHVLELMANSNQVTSLKCLQDADLPWCQRVNFADNQMTALPPLSKLQRLRFVNFARNQITSVQEFGGHPVLEELDLEGNQITSLVGLGPLPKLKRLVLTGNQLPSVEGLDTAELTCLMVSSNPMTSIAHITGAPRCSELKIGENQLSSEDPSVLNCLGSCLPELTSLELGNCPLVEALGDDLRAQVVMRIPKLKSLDGELVTKDDRTAARELKVQSEQKAQGGGADEEKDGDEG